MWDHQKFPSALDSGRMFICSLEWEILSVLVQKFINLLINAYAIAKIFADDKVKKIKST